MKLPVARVALAALVLASLLFPSLTAYAAPLSEPVDCSIQNQTPSVQLGAEAMYVVSLSGGSGSYSVSFAYGDGWVDTRSVTGPQTSFSHWFGSAGTFTQTATVSSLGSSATCTTQTTVW